MKYGSFVGRSSMGNTLRVFVGVEVLPMVTFRPIASVTLVIYCTYNQSNRRNCPRRITTPWFR